MRQRLDKYLGLLDRGYFIYSKRKSEDNPVVNNRPVKFEGCVARFLRLTRRSTDRKNWFDSSPGRKAAGVYDLA